jgi:hypothetical protein
VLVAVEIIIAVNAVYGGIGLIRDRMGMPDEWLERTPFTSWLWPGVFLLLVIAVPMAVAAVMEIARSRWAYTTSLAAALAQVRLDISAGSGASAVLLPAAGPARGRPGGGYARVLDAPWAAPAPWPTQQLTSSRRKLPGLAKNNLCRWRRAGRTDRTARAEAIPALVRRAPTQ